MLRRTTLAATAIGVMSVTAQAAEVTVYEIPGDAVYPEGIAYDPQTGVFYTGSAADGTIYRGDVESRDVEVFIPGGGTDGVEAAFGMKTDAQERLWIAGGPTGKVWAYDTGDRSMAGAFEVPEGGESFLNDLIVAPDGSVYVTDSYRPILYRISASDDDVGELEAWLDFTGTALEYETGEGIAAVNLNGIEATDDGQYLITVQMNTGKLFRIDTDSQEVVEIDLGDGDLTNGDGLVLDGRTLYVVRIVDEDIAVVELNDDYTAGEVVANYTHPDFVWPATAARADDALLVVNTQFNRREAGNPELPFTVMAIPVEMIR